MLPLQKVWVFFLVWELRSHMPHGVAKHRMKKKTPFFKKNQSLFQWQNFYSSQSLWNYHLVNKYLLTSTMHHIHSTSESPQWMWGDKTRNQSLALGSFPYGLTETFPLPPPSFCIFSLSWKSDVHSHRLNLITDFLYSKIITTSS